MLVKITNGHRRQAIVQLLGDGDTYEDLIDTIEQDPTINEHLSANGYNLNWLYDVEIIDPSVHTFNALVEILS